MPPSLGPDELLEVYGLAIQLAQKAGTLILRSWSQPKRTGTKANELDLVSDTDVACEALIKEGVFARYPQAAFIGEESFSAQDTAAGRYIIDESLLTWCVDPIDGTNNYTHGLPHVCISIGVLYGGVCQVAVVYAPVLKEIFSAVRGQGAFLSNEMLLDKKQIKTSSKEVLSQSAIGSEIGIDRTFEGMQIHLGRLRELTVNRRLQSLRMLGSCALNLCNVACGRLEAFYEGRNTLYGPKLWDSIAGALIVQEAGGVMKDTNGECFDPTNGRVLAACNETISQLVLDALRTADTQNVEEIKR